MTQVSLDLAGWTVRAVGDLSAVPSPLRGREVPAKVPGCVHTDLIRAGLIPDPLVGMNEREVQWIGETDFEYRAVFEADADLLKHERVDLVCEGLDTIAELRLNGVKIGRAANMFHPHRFDLRAAIRPGTNELSITFRSPLKHIRAEEARLGKRPVNGDWDPYIFIRKAACNFGWDWAPKLATCGIWKPVRLEGWSEVRIADVRPVTVRIDQSRWEVRASVSLDWADASAQTPWTLAVLLRDIHLSVTDTHNNWINEWQFVHFQSHESELRVTIPVSNPRLWSARQPAAAKPLLCWLETSLHPRGSPRRIDDRSAWIGFREVKLTTPGDEHGSGFTLEINGRPVFCKGANWIPEGPWPAEVSRETLRRRLEQAAAANINMLRVWGGGYYESDAFYEICDELGIMVWQDFMFACAMYPEEEPYPKLIEAEARHQISRLSSHPSVVLWCGGNECVWAHDAWGNAPGERPWKERLGDKSWGEGYYFDLLP